MTASTPGWAQPANGKLRYYTTPPATGQYIGQQILVPNPAVPRGQSRLEWTGTLWAPPAGELIAGKWRDATPVALVTPGVVALTQIWAGAIIPDYMLPEHIKCTIKGALSVKNASGVSGCRLLLSVSGTVPPTGTDAHHPIGNAVTPTASGVGIGTSGSGPTKTVNSSYVSVRAGKDYFAHTGNSGHLEGAAFQPYVAGANRLYAMALPSSAADQFQLDGMSLISEGNL